MRATLGRLLILTFQRPRRSAVVRVKTPTRSQAATNRSMMSFDMLAKLVAQVLVRLGSMDIRSVDEGTQARMNGHGWALRIAVCQGSRRMLRMCFALLSAAEIGT